MNKYLISPMAVLTAITFTSCKSAVTAEDVMGQQRKAMAAIEHAQEELVELAELKEKYSVDGIRAEIKKLKVEKSKVDKDIKKLSDVSHNATETATAAVLADLKSKSEQIQAEISELESKPKEDWSGSIESINSDIKDLEQEVAYITENLTKPES